jgi:hypothetical protein
MKSVEGSNDILGPGHATLGTQYISFGSSTGIYLQIRHSVESRLGAEADLKIPALGYPSVEHYPRGWIKFQIVRSDHSQMGQSREKPTEVQRIVTDSDKLGQLLPVELLKLIPVHGCSHVHI